MNGPELAAIGAVLANEARATMLAALMDGRARTGRELANVAGIAPSTASEHLARAVDAGLVAVEAAGRHRHFRLAGQEVAAMMEAMGAVPIVVPGPKAPGEMRRLRSCYDHLAGEIAVGIHDRCLDLGLVATTASHNLEPTDVGRRWLTDLGITIDATTRRTLLRPCLDWTERRHHLGGSIAAGMFTRFVELGWVERRERTRALRITRAGKAALTEELDMSFESAS